MYKYEVLNEMTTRSMSSIALSDPNPPYIYYNCYLSPASSLQIVNLNNIAFLHPHICQADIHRIAEHLQHHPNISEYFLCFKFLFPDVFQFAPICCCPSGNAIKLPSMTSATPAARCYNPILYGLKPLICFIISPNTVIAGAFEFF